MRPSLFSRRARGHGADPGDHDADPGDHDADPGDHDAAILAIMMPIPAIMMRRSWRSRCADLRDQDRALPAATLAPVVLANRSTTHSKGPVAVSSAILRRRPNENPSSLRLSSASIGLSAAVAVRW